MLYYIHIPKTAGVSIYNFLGTIGVYGYRIYHSVGFWNAKEIEKAVSGSKIVYGHFNFGLHEILNDSEPKYITTLRHPVDRVISLYKHQKSTPGSVGYKLINRENWTLRDFVESRKISSVNNGMTRMLTERSNFSYLGYCTNKIAKLYSTYARKDKVHFIQNPKYLKRALKNLHQHFLFVGQSTQIVDTLKFLLHFSKASTNRNYLMPRENISPPEDEVALDASTLALIEEANNLDLGLYQAVCKDPEQYHACLPENAQNININFINKFFTVRRLPGIEQIKASLEHSEAVRAERREVIRELKKTLLMRTEEYEAARRNVGRFTNCG